jgi:photosystem II stability/assembly factor-like uncharacterized protein
MHIKSIIIMGLLTVVLCVKSDADDNVWSTNGPEGGRVWTIAIDPDNNQHILIGTVDSGMYKTTDGGTHWSRIISDVLDRSPRDIAFYPGAPDTVYTATLNGLFRSQNGGETWNLIQLPIGPHNDINDVEIHLVHHNIIFAVGDFTQWRSSDSGISWDTLRIPGVAVLTVRTDPLRPDTMYLTTHSRSMHWSVFRSINLGLDWESIHNDLDTNIYVMDLQIDPVNSDILYLGGVNWQNVSGVCICKSIDGGAHWLDITPDSLIVPNVESLTISPIDHNIIYACTDKDGVLKSVDGGENWVRINEGLSGRFMRQVVADPITGYLYLGTIFGGIYTSTNGGASWQKISSNIFNANCLDIAVHPRDADSAYVAAENGFFRTIDGGRSWETAGLAPRFFPARTPAVEIDMMDPNFIFMSTYHTGPYDSSAIFRSSDGGGSWVCLPNPIPVLYNLAISNNGSSRRLFAGYQGIYYSDNDGASWQLCGGGLPADEYFWPLYVSPADPARIYAVGAGYYLWRSTDRGETWGESAQPPGGEVISFAVDPIFSSVLYAGTFDNGLFKSTDAGDSWSNITNNLPVDPDFIYITGMAVNPSNSQNLVAYSFGYGMYMSHDSGSSWELFNDSLPLYCTGGYGAFSPVDTSRLYFASLAGSVWSIRRTTDKIEDDGSNLPKSLSLSAYPNPFNAAVLIKYNVPKNENIRIVIYDIMGRQQAVLLKGPKMPGSYSLTWDASALPSGVYLALMAAGNYNQTIKITLLK